ncbi:MAG: J domain-containing protein [Burkholderiales bacterium]|nr:J domain-containing protein [Burkholderiales bacterium]
MDASHYDILNVDRLASADLVRDAYRRMAQKFHPDKCHDDAQAAGLMARINEAYEVLSDSCRRAQYDMSLASRNRRRLAASRAVMRGQDAFGWSWYLLGGAALVTVLTLGLVAVRFAAPPQPVFPARAQLAQQEPAADPLPLVAAQRIQPWTEPPRSQRPVLAETEPVMRLVREGVMRSPPSRQ